jgi:MFS family permease
VATGPAWQSLVSARPLEIKNRRWTHPRAETLARERTPEHVRGRVFGSLQASVWLMSLLGAVVGGVLGELVGLLAALDLASALVTLSGVVVLLAIPRHPSPRPLADVIRNEA